MLPKVANHYSNLLRLPPARCLYTISNHRHNVEGADALREVKKVPLWRPERTFGTPPVWLNSMREELRCGGLHLETAESCADLLQRRNDTAGVADDGPLASRARKVENTVGGLGKAFEERPERRTWCDTFLTPCSRYSTSKARS